ncbi:MAG: DUF5320 domain-containing protein [Desulfovibrionaceae bacterium]|nr:DUF5320 domain-containing protein [Desulfovibrionaceae bacterium]MDD4952255.1 DUF5320 domain-containing protein [Desulfovibrionaceae bacterium]
MPGFDMTGPLGQGPMTGRGAGRCSGQAGQGRGPGFGRGLGFRRGFGPGRGLGFGRGLGRGGFGLQQAGDLSGPSNKDLRDRLDWLESEAARIREQLNSQNG